MCCCLAAAEDIALAEREASATPTTVVIVKAVHDTIPTRSAIAYNAVSAEAATAVIRPPEEQKDTWQIKFIVAMLMTDRK